MTSSESKKVLKGPRFVLKRGGKRYPASLETIDNPPERIYGIGNESALVDGLAVIGARKATPYGLACARKFAGYAAARGVVIISGGAYGCDQAAHHAALENQGRTVAVLGGGCDCVYPARHFDLFQNIIDAGGAVISEQNWNTAPKPYMFRKRNRLIAGLAKAILIVEAGDKSGTFSTADNALNSDRDVLVIPGPITSENSLGSNRLLLQGAAPIVDDESFDDALLWHFGVLKTPGTTEAPRNEDFGFKLPEEKEVLAMLRAQPMRIEDICAALQVKGFEGSEATTLLTLSLMEIEGIVCRYNDGRYGVEVR